MYIPKLSAPPNVFVTVIVTPCTKGVPLDYCELFCPTDIDYLDWHTHCVVNFIRDNKKRRENKYVGYDLNNSVMVNNRKPLGVVTSGNDGGFVIGICNAIILNEMFRFSFKKDIDSNVMIMRDHQLVMFRNCKSHWLRPCLIKVISH